MCTYIFDSDNNDNLHATIHKRNKCSFSYNFLPLSPFPSFIHLSIWSIFELSPLLFFLSSSLVWFFFLIFFFQNANGGSKIESKSIGLRSSHQLPSTRGLVSLQCWWLCCLCRPAAIDRDFLRHLHARLVLAALRSEQSNPRPR